MNVMTCGKTLGGKTLESEMDLFVAEEESVDKAASFALEEFALPNLQLQVHQDKEGKEHKLRAIKLLGWLAKALAMRSHPLRFQPLETALAYLEASSLDLVSAQEEQGFPPPSLYGSQYLPCMI